MKFALYLSIFLASTVQTTGFAVEFTGKPVKTIEGVNVYPEVKLGAEKLYLTGAGLRTKTVVIVKANVYVAAHYLDAGVVLDPKEPMKGLAQSKNRVLHLTFLRDLTSDKIKDSFKDALKENGVDTESGAVKKIFSELNFDMKEKGTVALVGSKLADGTEQLLVEGPTQILASGKGLVSLFWTIWFGKPADGGLEDLKAELLGKRE